MLPLHYATEAPAPAPASSIDSNSSENVGLIMAVVLFGAVFLLVAMWVWCWYPSALEEEGGGYEGAAAATAASRPEKKRARLEYVHRALKTRSWHVVGSSPHPGTSLQPTDTLSASIADPLTVSSGDGDDGRGDVECSSTSAPPHRDPHRHFDEESSLSTTESPLPKVSNQATLTPSGSMDSEPCHGDDDGDKKLGTDEDDDAENDQAGDEGGPPACAICLCPFREHDTVCESSNHACTHLYHPRCLEPWLVLHEQCPVCRAAYLPRPRSMPVPSRKRWSCGGGDGTSPGGRATARR